MYEFEMDEATPLFKTKNECGEKVVPPKDQFDISLKEFKIEIKNLPDCYTKNDFCEMLKKTLNLDSTKLENKKDSTSLFIYFCSDEARNKAIEKLNGFVWNGKPLEAIRVDCLDNKRKGFFEKDGPTKKIKIYKDSQEEQLKNDVNPLWDVPYNEQLKHKFKEAKKFMKGINTELLRQNPTLKKYLNEQNSKFEGLPCELLDIRYSDKCDGYRNEFSFFVGINKETQLPTVGCWFKNQSRGIGSIESLKDIPDSMKFAVKLFEDYVRNSDLKVYYSDGRSGHFRRLTVRIAENQIMLIVGIHPQNLSQEKLQKFKDSLIYYFTEGAGKEAKITSLNYEKIFKKAEGVEHLWGDTHITQTFFGLKLKISPETSFQLNTKVSEIIYKSIIELLPQENSTILCCGSGTTGLILAKNCKKVLNIEDGPQSIIDATENAKLNKIENCEFFEGEAKEILESVCNKVEGDVIAVIDPSKVCLQKKAVIKIRNSTQIGKVVCVFMDPKSAFRGLFNFGRSSSKSFPICNDEPFVPEKAIVVDMLPHTNDYKLIISFKRLKKQEADPLIKSQNQTYVAKALCNFSSEQFKIEIKNLPDYYTKNELRKLLNHYLKLDSKRIETLMKFNSPFAFVYFSSNKAMNKAIEVLNGYEWNTKILQANRVDCARESNFHRFHRIRQEEELKRALIPFRNVPYQRQLRCKFEEVKKFLKELGKVLIRGNSDLRKYIDNQKSVYEGFPCELLHIRYADEFEGYRNHCSFTIGIDKETLLPIVGLKFWYCCREERIGSIESLNHLPDSMKLSVKLFQDYVRNSELKVFNSEANSGHFRRLTVRTAENQVMLIVGIHPQDLSEKKLEEFKNSLIYYFTEGMGKEAKITSLYYEKIVKKITSEEVSGAEHLWGETHISETLCGLKFRISPEMSFQLNTKAAEILYKSVIELSQAKNSTILDICWDNSIGLCFAKNCKEVLSIINELQAILDAKENAKLNEIENIEFILGKTEDILWKVCQRAEEDIIAVVNPGQRIIEQIRNVNQIGQILYVLSAPKCDVKNFVEFVQPISDKEPFLPEKVIVVDMFPHTNRYELVISFKRFDKL